MSQPQKVHEFDADIMTAAQSLGTDSGSKRALTDLAKMCHTVCYPTLAVRLRHAKIDNSKTSKQHEQNCRKRCHAQCPSTRHHCWCSNCASDIGDLGVVCKQPRRTYLPLWHMYRSGQLQLHKQWFWCAVCTWGKEPSSCCTKGKLCSAPTTT